MDVDVSIIKANSNEAHGDVMISIRMLKLCNKSICKPLTNSQKNDKQCIKNYRPVSLLPICSKVFECIIYNTMFPYFIENNLISKNQSGFKPGDSCVNQLLATHDDSYEVRGIFLGI